MRLTSGRREILEILVRHANPMGAYDLIEQVQKMRGGQRVHPQTVYRGLDFLQSAGLIHRIAGTGQFVLCEHISCKHQHRPSQFLVCNRCGAVREMELSPEQLTSFEESMQASGFFASPNGIEIHGECSRCREISALEKIE